MSNGKTIDPAMRPATVLGKSTIGGDMPPTGLQNISTGNNTAYQRSVANLKRQQEAEVRQRESIAKGLTDLSVKVSAWEDQEGFKEIMEDHQKIINVYLELSKGGLNILSPKTEDEVKAYKAITEAQARVKQKVDVYDRNKKQYDAIQTLIQQDLSRTEPKLDHAATYANFENQLKTGKIMDRELNLSSLLVYKPDIVNLDKFVDENKDRITIPMMDPETGVPDSRMVLRQEEDLKNLYQALDEKQMEALKKEKERATKINSKMEVVPLEDFFVSRYSYAAQGKLTRRLQQMDEEERSVPVKFLNTEAKILPGELHTNDNILGGRNYNERYDFSFPTRKLFKVPAYGGFTNTGTPDPETGQDGWEPIKSGDYVEAELLFYDPKSDRLIFRSGETSENLWIKNNTTFDVPRKNLPGSEELPIMVDGKMKKLKDILPEEEKDKPTNLPLPEDFWGTPVPEKEKEEKRTNFVLK